jgi:hypothetical protein
MALNAVEQAYHDQGVTAFRRDNVIEDRQKTVEACLEVSLRHLADSTPVGIQARERYQELAVFPEDIDIPLTELKRFWQATGSLEP